MNCCDKQPKQGPEQSGFRSLLTGPRRFWLLGAVVIAASLAMGWDQLVLFGIAPILIGLLPCVVMCGLGLCMMKCKDKKDKPADQGETSNVQASIDSHPASKETA